MPQSYGRVEGSMKAMLPLGRRILVRPHSTPDYKGNIIIPDNCKSTVPTTGTVLALGFDFEKEDPLREGDQICYSVYGGVELKFDDGSKVLIIHEDDVLSIIRGGEVRISPDVEAMSNGGGR